MQSNSFQSFLSLLFLSPNASDPGTFSRLVYRNVKVKRNLSRFQASSLLNLVPGMKNISPEPVVALGSASISVTWSKALCQLSYGGMQSALDQPCWWVLHAQGALPLSLSCSMRSGDFSIQTPKGLPMKLATLSSRQWSPWDTDCHLQAS